MKDLSVKFDLENSEFYTALRLVAGAVCSIAERDIDAAEDFKVCVTESALILKNCGFKTLNAVFCAENGVKARTARFHFTSGKIPLVRPVTADRRGHCPGLRRAKRTFLARSARGSQQCAPLSVAVSGSTLFRSRRKIVHAHRFFPN